MKTGAKNNGFTIIETLIVLAIAGFILLVVFEAIPALQRSSRNNQRKQDVASILRSVSHYELNNSGNFPSTVTLDSFLQLYGKLSYYNPTHVAATANTATDATTPIANTTTVETAAVFDYAKCDSNSDGSATNAAAGYSDIVALYALESGNGAVTRQCQQL
jgi:prepilin-type N-terminal cleavage/methylation domain-containing protein